MSVATKTKTFVGIIAVGVVLAAAGLFDSDGEEDKDYSDRNKYRLATWQVLWTNVGEKRTTMHFQYDVGSNKGSDNDIDGSFSVTGYVRQGQVIRMTAGVLDIQKDVVRDIFCQAFLEGKALKSDMTGEPGKLIFCTAVAAW